MEGKIIRCPMCDNRFEGYPAVSRRDNETEICSDCGQWEAIESFRSGTKQQLARQYDALEADKQEALERIRNRRNQ